AAFVVEQIAVGDRTVGLVETPGAIATDLEELARQIVRHLDPLQTLPQRARDGFSQALAGQASERARQPMRLLVLDVERHPPFSRLILPYYQQPQTTSGGFLVRSRFKLPGSAPQTAPAGRRCRRRHGRQAGRAQRDRPDRSTPPPPARRRRAPPRGRGASRRPSRPSAA